MGKRGLLHAGIDALPDTALDEVSRYLATHCDDPVLRSLSLAPPENAVPSLPVANRSAAPCSPGMAILAVLA
jgi:hypothetical protein